MRRAILSLTTMGLAVLLASGLALAADVSCGGGYCEGTTGDDTMYGGGGADRLQGGERPDTLNGGRGNDRIDAEDGQKDAVNCGRGAEDVAFFDRGIDEVRNCEVRNPPVG